MARAQTAGSRDGELGIGFMMVSPNGTPEPASGWPLSDMELSSAESLRDPLADLNPGFGGSSGCRDSPQCMCADLGSQGTIATSTIRLSACPWSSTARTTNDPATSGRHPTVAPGAEVPMKLEPTNQ